MPDSWIGLAVALLAIVPGFLAITTWARARTWRGPSTDLRTILQSLAISAAIQIAVSPLTIAWIVPIRRDVSSHASRFAVWFFVAVIAVPLVAGFVVARATDLLFDHQPPRSRWRTRFARALAWVVKAPWPPSIWDWLFQTGRPDGRFVVVRFMDGSQVGGVFAKGSIAFTSPEQRGLFLANEWRVDDNGNFSVPVSDSHGILIPKIDEVQWVRILEYRDEQEATLDG